MNIDSFSNGVVVYTSFLDSDTILTNQNKKELQRTINLLFILPPNPLIKHYLQG